MKLGRRYAAHGITTHPPGQYFDQLSDLYAGKLLMVMDRSASMKGRRLREAVAGACDLLGQAINESYIVGAVSFSGNARLELDLTTDPRAVERALKRLDIDWTGTMMSQGISLAHRLLLKRRGERVIAIFSDGEDQNPTAALAAAAAARRDEIRIIAALGGSADPRFMREITGEGEDPEVVNDRQVREKIAGMAALLRPTWR